MPVSHFSDIQNPFLILRFVFFGILANLNFLTVIFASWNIVAGLRAGLSASGTSVASLFCSCMVILCIFMGLVELCLPYIRIAQINFECFWSVTLTVVQTGTAIAITVNRPAISDWAVESSNLLLVPTSWLSSLAAFTYFLALFAITMAHSRENADIWIMTVYSVNWFKRPDFRDVEGVSVPSDLKSYPITDQSDKDGTAGKAPWAQQIRRGVDVPFKRSECLPLSTHTSATLATLPVAPPKARSITLAGSRFIENFRESRIIARMHGAMDKGSKQVDSFPAVVEDHNLPIPLPHLSEWVSADRRVNGTDTSLVC